MELHDENLKAKIEKKKTKIRKMLGKLVFFFVAKIQNIRTIQLYFQLKNILKNLHVTII
jgi:hypothetical protein